MKILIVDDDEVALDVLRHELAGAGHEVTAVTNGVEALDALRRDEFRLVISDWSMPEMDGLELCRRVRGGGFPSYIYIMLLTARSGAMNVVQGLSAGADDFLTKPFDSNELRVRIRAAERVLSLETRDVTIFALAKLAESRDHETGEHLERVQSYCRLIARELAQRREFRGEISPEFVNLVHQTSPLHDIGKVGIPDRILLKPGPLDPNEFDVMKTHTTIGAQTLEAANRRFPEAAFLRVARDIALTHHERYDGGGYPQGLAERAIPLGGRIMAVADVYDALTSRRVYKQAVPHEKARQMVLRERGKQFDPAVVDAFAANEQAFEAMAGRDNGNPQVPAAVVN